MDGKDNSPDLIWIPVDNGWHSEIICLNRLVADLELKVAAIVKLRPLQLAVVLDQIMARIIRCG